MCDMPSIVGGYVLHLYCTHEDHPTFFRVRDEWFGSNKREAFSIARKNGWRINEKAGIAECPSCVTKEKATARTEQVRKP